VDGGIADGVVLCRGGGGRRGPGGEGGGKRGDPLGEREREGSLGADQGRRGGEVVYVPEKNPYNPIGTMYSCEFARLSGCSRVFGH